MSYTIETYFRQPASPAEQLRIIFEWLGSIETIDVVEHTPARDWCVMHEETSVHINLGPRDPTATLGCSDWTGFHWHLDTHSSFGRSSLCWGIQLAIPAYLLLLVGDVLVHDCQPSARAFAPHNQCFFTDVRRYEIYAAYLMGRSSWRALQKVGLVSAANERLHFELPTGGVPWGRMMDGAGKRWTKRELVALPKPPKPLPAEAPSPPPRPDEPVKPKPPARRAKSRRKKPLSIDAPVPVPPRRPFEAKRGVPAPRGFDCSFQVAFSPSGRYLASCRWGDGQITVWDVDEGKVVFHVRHTDAKSWGQLAWQGERWICYHQSVFDVVAHREVLRFGETTEEAYWIGAEDEPRWLVRSEGADSFVEERLGHKIETPYLVVAEEARLLGVLPLPGGCGLHGVLIPSDGSHLVIHDRYCCLFWRHQIPRSTEYDTQCTEICDLDDRLDDALQSWSRQWEGMAISADGNYVAALERSRGIVVIPLADPEQPCRALEQRRGADFNSGFLAHDGDWVGVVDDDVARVWDLRTGSVLLDCPPGSLSTSPRLALHQSRRLLARGGKEGVDIVRVPDSSSEGAEAPLFRRLRWRWL